MSIFKKIVILVSSAIVILGVVLCITCEIIISSMGNKAINEQLLVSSDVVQREITGLSEAQSILGRILQDNPAFSTAVATSNKEMLRKATKELIGYSEVDVVTICDADGVVLLRSHSDQAGDKQSDKVAVNMPLTEGKIVSGMETDGSGKLALVTGMPIRHEGRIIGAVVIGANMDSGAFVGKMKNLLGVECTIFVGDIRVSTTVINNEGKPAIGTKLNNDDLYKRVIENGERVLGHNTIMGAEYNTVYWPWKNTDGKNTGILFVGLPRAIIRAIQLEAVLYFVLICIVAGAVALAVGISVARAITRPLREAMLFAEQVAQGNLDGTISVKSNDEVGAMSRALGVMVETLKKMIIETREKSREAEEHAEKAMAATKESDIAKEKAEAGQRALLHTAADVELCVDRVTAAVDNINSQIEASTNLVASQNERVTTSAGAMEEMNATVLDVAKSASIAAEGSKRATEKAQEGEQIVKESVTAIKNVQSDIHSLQEVMQNLGEQARSIGSVMTVINDIADQTNLLALNAAIEAARAGEAGRGFAVVADEVRKLAEKTMDATKEVSSAITGIQSGTRASIDAVTRTEQNLESTTGLVSRSGEALHIIVTESAAIADQIHGIATASEEQTATSQEIMRSLEEINASASETATAMRTSETATRDLAGQTHELQEIVHKLRAN